MNTWLVEATERPRPSAPQAERYRNAVPSFRLLDAAPDERSRSRRTAAVSILLHFIVVLVLETHRFGAAPWRAPARTGRWADSTQSVQLVSPLFELPQSSPNRGRGGAATDLEMFRPGPRMYAPSSIPKGIPQAAAPRTVPVQDALPGPPLAGLAPLSPQGTGGVRIAATATLMPDTKPGVPFDLVPPSNSSPKDPREMSSAAWLVVGNAQIVGGGMREGQGLSPAPPGIGSSIELLTDPHGVEFEPFLSRLLSLLRRNWSHAPPRVYESETAGQAWIEFQIHRSGPISAVRVKNSWLAAPLLRALTYGIETADPVASLPPGYPEASVRVQVFVRYRPPAR